MEVKEIIVLIKNKDEKGLSFLYDNYGNTLLGLILRIVHSQELSEEILQQVFLKIWNKIESYDELKSSFFTWMARIARNAAIDQSRLNGFKNRKITDGLSTGHHQIEGKANINLSKIDTDRLLDKVDEKYKVVLDYIYLKGYSQSQVAEELKIPLGTVKTRLRKSIEILRDSLKNEKTIFMSSSLLLLLIIYLLWN